MNNKTGWRPFFLASIVTAALLLSACASLPPPQVGETQEGLVARRGAPSRIWYNDDGSRRLEYSTQPYGTTCWMVDVASNGQVIQAFDGLSAMQRANIKNGMSPDEVTRLLGQHISEVYYSLSGEVVRDWNVDPGGFHYRERFNVHFKEQKVVATSSTFYDPYENQWEGLGFYSPFYGMPGIAYRPFVPFPYRPPHLY